MGLRPGILLDRDGTINRDRPDYIRSWEDFEFLPGVLDALRAMASLGVPVCVITNQSAIGRGYMSLAEMERINALMVDAVRDAGGRIDAVYYCPHLPWEGCECRKPAPGMLIRAAREHALDLSISVMIGNKATDVAAAFAAGCPSLLLTHEGYEEEAPADGPVVAVHDLVEAAELVGLRLGEHARVTA